MPSLSASITHTNRSSNTKRTMKDKPHYDHKRDKRRPRLGTIVEEDEHTGYVSEKYKPKKKGVITLTKSELINSAMVDSGTKVHKKNLKNTTKNASVKSKNHKESTTKDRKDNSKGVEKADKQNKGKLKRFVQFMTVPKDTLL